MHYSIVVCDDEEDVGFIEKAFYEQPGNIAVKSFNSGLQFLQYLSKQPPRDFPFLIIINHYLPDMESLLLLQQLKAHAEYKLIPVAIMSGFASEDLIREYYLAGANCFYKKPFDTPDWAHMADCLLTLFYPEH